MGNEISNLVIWKRFFINESITISSPINISASIASETMQIQNKFKFSTRLTTIWIFLSRCCKIAEEHDIVPVVADNILIFQQTHRHIKMKATKEEKFTFIFKIIQIFRQSRNCWTHLKVFYGNKTWIGDIMNRHWEISLEFIIIPTFVPRMHARM